MISSVSPWEKHYANAISEFKKIGANSDPRIWDLYFGKYAAPVHVDGRFSTDTLRANKMLMLRLYQTNAIKYKAIHKGTAFYLMSYSAFLSEEYEAALSLMSAALNEDIKKNKGILPDKKDSPAVQFFYLDTEGNGTMRPFIEKLREKFNSTVTTYQKYFAKYSSIEPNVLIEKIVNNNIVTNNGVILLSEFYSFLFRYRAICANIEMLSSTESKSNVLEINYLVSASILFETLLKQITPGKTTLGDSYNDILLHTRFPEAFPNNKTINDLFLTIKNLNLEQISEFFEKEIVSSQFEKATIWSCFQIRNQLTHSFEHTLNIELFSNIANMLTMGIVHILATNPSN